MLGHAARSDNAPSALRRRPRPTADLEVPMTTLARAITHVTGIEIDVETLEPVVIFCGIGIALSLILSLAGIKLYGLDLSSGTPF
jgi:hypothetical protein